VAEAEVRVEGLEDGVEESGEVGGPVDPLGEPLEAAQLRAVPLEGEGVVRPRGDPQRKPSTLSTRSTSNTSAALSLKMPLIPVWEAIAWMRRAMVSKRAPVVSERRKRRRRRKASKVTGS